MSLWIATVREDDSFALAGVARVPAGVFLSGSELGPDQFVVSGETHREARTMAEKILRRARDATRELDACRELASNVSAGYVAALDELAAFLAAERASLATPPAADLTPESVRANGVWFGRLDALDTMARWALSRRPKGG